MPNPLPPNRRCGGSALRVMIDQGIVREITGYARNRVFSYAEYLRTLNEGAEPNA